MNAGFLACHDAFSVYTAAVLESYERDFRPNDWLYNSGTIPMQIYKANPRGLYLDESVDNSPAWARRHEMLSQYGIHNWREKLGYHAFIHNCTFNMDDVRLSKSSFGELLRWIFTRAQELRDTTDTK